MVNEHHRQPWNTLPLDVRLQLNKKLTPRQHDVFVLWHAGCGYERIGTMLNLSPRTVRTHLRRAHAIYHNIQLEEAA